ncbi:MAG TPA: Spo0E family sporulation regulatory protein-aspartic acid phosphatase [Clostridia bacterium]
MKNLKSRKESRTKPESTLKEELLYEREKMEKFIMDRVINSGTLTSEDVLMYSKAFDSLINKFMKDNYG